MNINLRIGTARDTELISDIYLASRKTFLSYAPLAHSDDEVREWIKTVLIPTGDVAAALVDDQIAGMSAISSGLDPYGWIDQLYVAPAYVGIGIGSLLLARAKAELGAPIRLYTFQANSGAKRFYERHGFTAIKLSDGSSNEERCPDALYEWSG